MKVSLTPELEQLIQEKINSGQYTSLPEKEQKEIVAALQICDRKISTLEKEIILTDELFHAILEKLMTGKSSTQPLINKEN